MTRCFTLTIALLGGLMLSTFSIAQDSMLTYQGQLRQAGTPFTGNADLTRE